VRVAYLIAAVVLCLLELSNYPRVPWIPHEDFAPIGIFRGFTEGFIGFSYMVSWALIIGGVYSLLLGVLYWDMDTSESKRWQFSLEGLGTARFLWLIGAVSLVLGILYAAYVYGHDQGLWPAGLASTVVAWLTCWFFWLAFPLYEQVGIDRDEMGL
jgi:hypothetical protein